MLFISRVNDIGFTEFKCRQQLITREMHGKENDKTVVYQLSNLDYWRRDLQQTGR